MNLYFEIIGTVVIPPLCSRKSKIVHDMRNTEENEAKETCPIEIVV